MRSSSEKILKDTGYLLGSSTIARIISGVAGIVTARILGPSDYGLLKIINYIPSLAKYGSFGFGAVVKREIPHLRGKQQKNEAVEERIRNVAFSVDILWIILLSILVFSISFAYERVEIRIGLWIASASLFVRGVGKLYGICMAVDKRFSTIAFISLGSNIISSAIILSTIYWGGIFSVLGASLAAGTYMLLYYSRQIHLNSSFSIPKDEFIRQFRVALPLAGGTASLGLFGWVERLQVSAMFGNEALGYYMLITFAIQGTNLLVTTFLRASSIEMYERLSEGENTIESKSFILKPSMAIGLLLPFVGGMAWLAGPLVLNILLPDYLPAKQFIPFMIPIVVFEGVSAMPRTALKSAQLNKQTPAMVLRLVSILSFSVVTYIAGYRFNCGLLGAIYGRSIASFVMFIGGYGMTVESFFTSITSMFKTAFEITLPAILMTLLCFILSEMIDIYSLKHTILKIALMLILYAPIVVAYERQLRIIKVLRKAL